MIAPDPISHFRKLCFGYSDRRLAALHRLDWDLAHYTTAENGLNILNGKSLWLRSASVMNDFSEIKHGWDCLSAARHTSSLESDLRNTVNSVHPGLADEIFEKIDQDYHNALRSTYMTSLSQIKPNDNLGRLSMWRAYGGPRSGVAFIFSRNLFQLNSQDLRTIASPVLYGNQKTFEAEFAKVVVGIELHKAMLKNVPRLNMFEILYSALYFSILSTKHPAFKEENEWRLVHSPWQLPSPHVKKLVRSSASIPQIIYDLPLENRGEMHIENLSFDYLITKVLIGPTSYPEEVRNAYVEILEGLGVSNAKDRVMIADVPLRQS